MRFFVLFLLIFSSQLFSEVDAPDYSFTFRKLGPILPGKSTESLDQKKWPMKFVEKQKDIRIYEGKLRHENYHFPYFVSIENKTVVELFIKLPSYFVHDLFHQSIINRYKKQDLFINRDARSIYIWKSSKIGKITYTANCTITCFPDFLHIISKEKSLDKKFKSFILKMLK